jgi:hypothetical protein
MSHTNGACKFKDNTILFYEYNGINDTVISLLHDNLEGVSNNWRSGKEKICNCGEEEEVEIYADYGGGYYFNGFACKKCRSVRPYIYDFDYEDAIDRIENNWAKNIKHFSIH